MRQRSLALTMKYVDEFRQADIATKLIERINRKVSRPWTIMEVCGGQTHSILQYGIEDLLPDDINLVHGPGCPVCVTPINIIDKAIAIAAMDNTIIASYGDMLRVPGSKEDLLTKKAMGADVRIVYSPLDSLKIARENQDKKVIFFAVGFETTAPANAMALVQAKEMGLTNFFMLASHVTVPEACITILKSDNCKVDGFIGPGHVCTVMGYEEYVPISLKYKTPIVITGFEPVDLLEGIALLIEELEAGRYEVVNQYKRAVKQEGNKEARAIIDKVFRIADRDWRGLGQIQKSGYEIRDSFASFDASKVFDTETLDAYESSLCISGEILMGSKKPTDCPEFGRSCNPENPLGATMVSEEGTCANYYKFKSKVLN